MKGEREGLPGLSVRRPFLAAVFNLLIVIAGLAALLAVEVRELPDVDRPIVSVRANYPGASPTTVDAEVTSLVERAVARVAGVISVRSSSEEGNFRMRIEFRPDQDLAASANDVREALSRIVRRLPAGVEDLVVVKSDRDAWPIIRVAVYSEQQSIEALTRKVEEQVVPEITAVEGVADVLCVRRAQASDPGGGLTEKASGLWAVDWRGGRHVAGSAVRCARRQLFGGPDGSVGAGDATVSDPERMKQLMLRDNVRLGDLADIYFSVATPQSVARLDGRMVLSLALCGRRSRIRSPFPTMCGVRSISCRNATGNAVPGDGGFRRLYLGRDPRSTAYLRRGVGHRGGCYLAVFRPLGRHFGAGYCHSHRPDRVAGGIWLLGFSVNLITLLALVLATGLVVDDAIVVTENIQRCRSRGMGRKAASMVGTREVFFAVIATTVTLIAVFVPISFLPSDAGRLFTEFGFVLAITVAISSFVALSVCPMIASRLDSLGDERGMAGPLGGWLSKGYLALLRSILRAPLLALVVAAVLAGSAGLIYGDLGEELVPAEDRGQVNVRLQGPDGTGLDYTDRQVEAVEVLLQPWVDDGLAYGLYSITGVGI